MKNVNAMINAITLKKSFKVGAYGNVVQVTDDRRHTTRFEFGSQQDAADTAMEFAVRTGMIVKSADMAWLKAEATRSRYMALGLIA